MEVKSTIGMDGRFDWPRKEFEKALRERDSYELWRIYRVADVAPVAKCFRNPAHMLATRQITVYSKVRKSAHAVCFRRVNGCPC
ncbi:protein NO VEIN domain-containing protein [Paraburkholderia caribensis]|uniref:protein NO VEIN domain-containing protein n=1 Tax=Paraburkholderia caribensis TaxID=75105 RepID=UPI003AAB4E18